MRLVSKDVNNALDSNCTNANFGLMFNKYLDYGDIKGSLVPEAKETPKKLIRQFNESKIMAADVLKRLHVQQADFCKAMTKAGWVPFVFHVRLVSPFVSGLGVAHPTETGMVLDHICGMPFIPVSSQKGVLRIAHIVNSLKDENGDWLSEEILKQKQIVNEDMAWNEDGVSKTLFGCGGDREALAGQLIILDAYPLKPPELKEEIINPHYSEYYQGKRDRGPTEDQRPIPVKFLVVKNGAEFVFRSLLRMPFGNAPIKDQNTLIRAIRRNLHQAIEEIGIGAKTSLGFGRFEVVEEGEPSEIKKWETDLVEARQPWKKWRREILASSGDWGRLKQIATSDEIKPHIANKEVARAIMTVAQDIKKKKAKKWTTERDKEVAEWLGHAGIEWPSCDVHEKVVDASTNMTEAQKELLNLIKGLDGWQEFKQAKINIKKLDLECCRALKEKFQQWKLKKSKDKAQKKAYKALVDRMNRLSK